MVNDSYYSSPEGSTFHINCSVTGQGVTSWFDPKGNRINNNLSDRLHVKTHGGVLLLEISKLNKSDVGRYECRGDQTRIRAMLYVECKYYDTINFKAVRTVRFSVNWGRLLANYGRIFTISCVRFNHKQPITFVGV